MTLKMNLWLIAWGVCLVCGVQSVEERSWLGVVPFVAMCVAHAMLRREIERKGGGE